LIRSNFIIPRRKAYPLYTHLDNAEIVLFLVLGRVAYSGLDTAIVSDIQNDRWDGTHKNQ